MEPPLNAAEDDPDVQKIVREYYASMEPPLNAAEDAGVVDQVGGSSPASMEPPLNAAEDALDTLGTTIATVALQWSRRSTRRKT